MLNTDLYKIVEHKRNEEIATDIYIIDINKNHNIFKGHFPNQPVMPGVCTLNIVKQLASDITGKNLNFSQIKDCKFLSAIIPDQNRELNIDIKLIEEKNTEPDIDNGQQYKIDCRVVCGETVMMKLKANLN